MSTGSRVIAVAVIAVAAAGVYGVCLSFAPISRDELLLLSSFERAPHPLAYFAGDWGLGNGMYRPLFSLTGWVTYRLFDVWALPGQMLSLALHISVIALLFDLCRRHGAADSTHVQLLVALVALISPYTMSGASWVVDRPTVMVGLSLMLAVRELLLQQNRPRMWVLALCAVAALLSKESGVVVAALILVRGVVSRRSRLVTLGAGVVVSYVLWRAALFGGRAVSYPESGVLLGIWPYVDSSQLSVRQFAVMLIDNPLRHVVATVLPVFGPEGENPSLHILWSTAPMWTATLALFVLALSRPSLPQQIGLAVVVLNAVSHYALFRTRTMYLSQLGFALYVATSPAMAAPLRRRCATVLLVVLLSWNATVVRQDMSEEHARRLDALTNDAARDFKLEDESAINRRIADSVLRRYGGR
jgi:hypothetical protein